MVYDSSLHGNVNALLLTYIGIQHMFMKPTSGEEFIRMPGIVITVGPCKNKKVSFKTVLNAMNIFEIFSCTKGTRK